LVLGGAVLACAACADPCAPTGPLDTYWRASNDTQLIGTAGPDGGTSSDGGIALPVEVTGTMTVGENISLTLETSLGTTPRCTWTSTAGVAGLCGYSWTCTCTGDPNCLNVSLSSHHPENSKVLTGGANVFGRGSSRSYSWAAAPREATP